MQERGKRWEGDSGGHAKRQREDSECMMGKEIQQSSNKTGSVGRGRRDAAVYRIIILILHSGEL